MKNLENKVAVVTGASRGIGRAIACEFAQRGAQVVINFSRNEEEAYKTLESLGENKSQGRVMGFDVSDSAQVEQAFEKIKAELGMVDILVNNAGVAKDGLILRLKDEDFDSQVNINLKGAFICCREASRHMIKKRSGRIINISSVVGEMGNAGQSIYAATKAGLIGMTKSLARELASRNILVNAITPGYIATDMTRDILDTAGDSVNKTILLGRVGEPINIAHAAAFLASPEASYITGHVLSVNGGLYI